MDGLVDCAFFVAVVTGGREVCRSRRTVASVEGEGLAIRLALKSQLLVGEPVPEQRCLERRHFQTLGEQVKASSLRRQGTRNERTVGVHGLRFETVSLQDLSVHLVLLSRSSILPTEKTYRCYLVSLLPCLGSPLCILLLANKIRSG